MNHMDSIKKHFGVNFKMDILSLEQLELHKYNEVVDNLKRYLNEPIDNRGNKRYSKITSSQLRNVFLLVKRCKEPKELVHIRPKLAYIGGRAENNETKEIVFLLEELVKEVDNVEKLKNLQSFFEAIIAYHKYFESDKQKGEENAIKIKNFYNR